MNVNNMEFFRLYIVFFFFSNVFLWPGVGLCEKILFALIAFNSHRAFFHTFPETTTAGKNLGSFRSHELQFA